MYVRIRARGGRRRILTVGVDADRAASRIITLRLTAGAASAATISPAVTREDTLRACGDDPTCDAQRHAVRGAASDFADNRADSGEVGDKISRAAGGCFIRTAPRKFSRGRSWRTNASAGLRFLPEKDANSFARREDGSRYVFAFDAYTRVFFNDSARGDFGDGANHGVRP